MEETKITQASVDRRIQEVKAQMPFEDRAYMEAISGSFFRFNEAKRIAFEFGFIEGYFKRQHTDDFISKTNKKD